MLQKIFAHEQIIMHAEMKKYEEETMFREKKSAERCSERKIK
jgi:hypothetical protein